MGGGLVQLVAYGSQDVYLTTNPQITFFKTVYHRYTNFAIESISQLIDGNINFDGNITAVISRNGDLLGSIFIEVQLFDPKDYILNSEKMDYCGWIQGVGNYLINSATINIGGQQIDNHYGKWMDIWSELVLNNSQTVGYGCMVGKNYSIPVWQPYETSYEPNNKLIIPLIFWFCRNPGLAIPLIALQYHEIKLDITFSDFISLVVGVKDGLYQKITKKNKFTPLFANTFRIWNTYYYLDTTERRKFAQNAHEYLIEQVQEQDGDLDYLTEPNYIRLNLSNPTKELIFVLNRNNSNAPTNDFSIGNNVIPNGTPNQFAPLSYFKLILNGSDRFRERSGETFRLISNYEYHTRIPTNYIYTYSFAIRPEEHQPSGTCNFSRIDTAQLYFVLRNGDGVLQNYAEVPSYTLYAPCYNILRIMGGMGGLAYSN
jgi:hypothetical protein